jgi:hypothetical protein
MRDRFLFNNLLLYKNIKNIKMMMIIIIIIIIIIINQRGKLH